MSTLSPAWMVSLHGGHSGEFCEHARGTLRATLERAVQVGFHAYGITEHAPRRDCRFLYDSERAKGYTVERLAREFEAYARASRELKREFADRLDVLRGFETEAVPLPGYAAHMRALMAEHDFDYMVGSVHHVAEIPIDENAARYRAAVDACGGMDAFLERYYCSVRAMIEELRPQVVGHLDLPKLHAPRGAERHCPRARRAAQAAVAAAKAHGCILDLNTAGLRKGLANPYPSPWLVRLARDAGVPFCFGDDSHDARQVGWGFSRAREYLLELGVNSVMTLRTGRTGLARRLVRLDGPEAPSRESAFAR